MKELRKEGESLRHCVATYAKRVVQKRTLILFVRKSDSPDKPFYTLEWNGDVVQCRGFSNKDMTDDVMEFVEKFQSMAEKRHIAQKLSVIGVLG